MKRRLQEERIVAFQYMKRAYKKEGEQHFNGLKVIGQGRMSLN